MVLGGQTLDELEQWVEELFSAVPNGRGLQPTYFDAGMPYQVILASVRPMPHDNTSCCLEVPDRSVFGFTQLYCVPVALALCLYGRR